MVTCVSCHALLGGPFRYSNYAGEYVRRARQFTKLPLKQAVIAPSALSLLYPDAGIKDYPRETFLEHLLAESEKDIRSCFEAGAETVQLDFTEGRLSIKLDRHVGFWRNSSISSTTSWIDSP
jgi:5-methyltetrahydropteroyltriglutamate--homocysteine methyltransferase